MARPGSLMADHDAGRARLRVLIVDDDQVLCDSISGAIGSDYNVEIASADDPMLVDAILAAKPDLVILDLALPHHNGLAITRLLGRRDPDIRVVVLTRLAASVLADQAIQFGAKAFVWKHAGLSDLRTALCEVAAGRIYVTPAASEPLNPNDAAACLAVGRLTDRERAVLALIARGMSNSEIGHALRLSTRGVHFHRSNIRGKLNIHSDAELVRFAVLAGQ